MWIRNFQKPNRLKLSTPIMLVAESDLSSRVKFLQIPLNLSKEESAHLLISIVYMQIAFTRSVIPAL